MSTFQADEVMTDQPSEISYGMFSKKYYIMTPGPTEVPREILETIVSDEALLPDYQEIYDIDVKLVKKLLNNDGEVVIMGGGATVGLEALISTFISENSKVLVLSAGYFGEILAKLIEMYHGKVDVIRERQGRIPSIEAIERYLSKNNVDYVVFAHCETSAGTIFNIEEIAKVVKENSNAKIIVDAVSTAGAIPINVNSSKKGVDAVVFGIQKALNMPPGLAVISLSRNIVEEMENLKPKGYYLNLKLWLNFWKTTRRLPSTPPINLLYGLRKSLERIFTEGIENVYRRHMLISGKLRNALRKMSLKIVAESDDIASPTVTVVYMPGGIKSEVIVRELWEKYGILVAKALGDISDKAIRIGHMGITATLDNIFAVVYALSKVLMSKGVNINLEEVLSLLT